MKKIKTGRIDSLKAKHNELNQKIADMYEAGWPGEYLSPLKIKKLRIKEELDRLEKAQ
jgi:hypothetical protein